MLNFTAEDYPESPGTNVIRFPQGGIRRSHAPQSQFGKPGKAAGDTSRETRRQNIQAEHRTLRERIEAIANARSIIMQIEIEIRLEKAIGGNNAAR